MLPTGCSAVPGAQPVLQARSVNLPQPFATHFPPQFLSPLDTRPPPMLRSATSGTGSCSVPPPPPLRSNLATVVHASALNAVPQHRVRGLVRSASESFPAQGPLPQVYAGAPPVTDDTRKPPESMAGELFTGTAVLFRDADVAWLNTLVGTLWPYIEKAVEKQLKEDVVPNIPVKGLSINRFSFGTGSPELGPLNGFTHNFNKRDPSSPPKIEMHIGIKWRGDPDIELKVLGATLGVQDLSLNGLLIVELTPLMESMPIVGGVSVYFLDAPDITWKFTGKLSMIPVKTIREAVENAINDMLVCPNRIYIDLTKGVPGANVKKQSATKTLMQAPMPVGVLRLGVKEAKNLRAADTGFGSSGKSDPYVVVRVGTQHYRTSTVDCNLNPVWTEEVFDIILLNPRQRLVIEVWDKDTASDDLLAKTTIAVHEMLDRARGNGGVVQFDMRDPEEAARTPQIVLTADFFRLSKTPHKALRDSMDVHCPECHVQLEEHPAHSTYDDCDGPGPRHPLVPGQSAGIFRRMAHHMGVKGEDSHDCPKVATCPDCDHQICEVCIQRWRRPAHVLQVCLDTGKLAKGRSPKSDRINVKVLGQDDEGRSSIPGVSSKENPDAVVGRLSEHGLDAKTIASCMGVDVALVSRQLEERKARLRDFDIEWRDALYFPVKEPVSRIKLAVTHLGTGSWLHAAKATEVEVNVSGKQPTFRTAVTLESGLVVEMGVHLLALWPQNELPPEMAQGPTPAEELVEVSASNHKAKKEHSCPMC